MFSAISFNTLKNTEKPLNFRNSATMSMGGGCKALKADTFVRSSNISFTGGVDTGLDGNAIKSLGNVTCPCCGLQIMDGEDINNLSKTVMNGPSKKALSQLAPFKDSMHEVERECFNLLEKLSEESPDKSIKDLLMTVRPEHLKNLAKIENSVMDEICEEIKNLPDTTSKPLQNAVESARKQINNNTESNFFKRKEFIETVNIIAEFTSDKEISDKIVKIVKTIPKSGDDLSAFIVKYTQNKPENDMPRTSFDIAKQLLIPSQGTIEHIHPHSEGGKDKISNYLWECQKCNSERGSDELPELKHIQKYMDEVIDIINSGGMKGYKAYPIEVAQTLDDESGGRIKVDTSALNIGEKEAENEIESRAQRHSNKEKLGIINTKRAKSKNIVNTFDDSPSLAKQKLISMETKVSYLQQPFLNHLKKLANAMPEKNFSQLMQTVGPVYEKRLIDKQAKVFDEIDVLSNSLADINKKRINKINEYARKQGANLDRSNYIEDIKGVTRYCINKDFSDKIEQAVMKLPSPENELSAFIVDLAKGLETEKKVVAQNPNDAFIKSIESQRKNMKPFELKVLNYLKQLVEQNPDENMKKILIGVRPLHLKNLIEKQTKIIEQATSLAGKLPPESASVIKSSLETYRRNIETNDNYEVSTKDFLTGFNKNTKKIPQKTLVFQIKKKIEEMPSGWSDLDAFMVRYSNKGTQEIRFRLTGKK